MTGRVVVIGAGLGGLAAACHLRGRGHDVTVLERDQRPGGRAGQWCEGGFRFDTGPTVVTMRHVLDDTFAALGVGPEDHVRLMRLDPAYQATFWDGSRIPVHADPEAMAEEIRQQCGPSEHDGYRRFVAWLEELYRAEMDPFISRDVSSPLDLAWPPAPLARLVRLGGFGRLERRMRTFFDDERLHRLFSFQTMYAGLSPLRALALYAVITHMDTIQGVWFPEGGVHALADGLTRALEGAGADVRCGVEVTSVATGRAGPDRRSPRATVVTAEGEHIDADAVVVNGDRSVGHQDLFGLPPTRRTSRARHSPSCVLWLIGSSAPAPASAAHHNIHFGQAWPTSFDELFEQGRPMSDPSRLVTMASLSDPGAAPAAHHTLNVIEPVPNLSSDLDWSSLGPRLTDRMLEWAGGQGYLDGEPVVQRTVTPLDWRAMGLGRGTPFAYDHRFTQSGPFRPGLEDRRLPGVVFVGASTRPGVGMPMVLLSGRLAADRVEEQLHA